MYEKWYDVVDEFHGRNLIMHDERAFRNPTKVLMRLKEEFREKIIWMGYSADEDNRKTMGMLFDLQRAFVGYQSPLTKSLEKTDPGLAEAARQKAAQLKASIKPTPKIAGLPDMTLEELAA